MERVAKRKALKTRVVFEDELGEGFLYFLSTDISVSGIFIESNIVLYERTKMFLKFSLHEGDRPIEVTGEVMRVVDDRPGVGRRRKNLKLGIGIRFIGLSVGDLARIEAFVNG